MADARRMMAETGCQSVMIGRGALGRPWVFDEAYDALPPIARRAYRARVIARHVALIQDHFDERFALVQLKKHLSWYTEGLGHARECRVADLPGPRRPMRCGRSSSATRTRAEHTARRPRSRPPPYDAATRHERRSLMQRMTGGQALVASLHREGVRVVFGLPGVQLYGAMAALRDEPRIRFIATRHEQATTYMADGYARAGGGIGVALVVPGPGPPQRLRGALHRLLGVVAGPRDRGADPQGEDRAEHRPPPRGERPARRDRARHEVATPGARGRRHSRPPSARRSASSGPAGPARSSSTSRRRRSRTRARSPSSIRRRSSGPPAAPAEIERAVALLPRRGTRRSWPAAASTSGAPTRPSTPSPSTFRPPSS